MVPRRIHLPLLTTLALISSRSTGDALPQNPSGFQKPPLPSYNNQEGSPSSSFPPPVTGFNDEPPREAFEDRAAAWRRYQQEKQQQQTATEAASPTDDEGRMKLLASVSNVSITFFFFVLMWRTVHHYELCDATFKGLTRILFVTPIVGLFLGNAAGCVASITSKTNSAKKRLKAILNINKLVEFILLTYNIIRLTVLPSKYVTREIYVGRTLSNFLFLVQCQLFTKVAWNAAKEMPTYATTASSYPDHQYSQQQPGPDGQNYYDGRGEDGESWL